MIKITQLAVIGVLFSGSAFAAFVDDVQDFNGTGSINGVAGWSAGSANGGTEALNGGGKDILTAQGVGSDSGAFISRNYDLTGSAGLLNFTYTIDFSSVNFTGSNFVEFDIRLYDGSTSLFEFNLHRTNGIYFSNGQSGGFGGWGAGNVNSGSVSISFVEQSLGGNMSVNVAWTITGSSVNTGSKSFTAIPHGSTQTLYLVNWRNSDIAGSAAIDSVTFDAGSNGVSVVPEPGSSVLVAGLAAAGWLLVGRRNRRA